MRNTLSMVCMLLAFHCSFAKDEERSQYGETFVYALGSLAAAKIQAKLRFESLEKPGDLQTFYQDFIMLYRRESIACDGLLDRVAPRLAKFSVPINSIERFGDPVLLIDYLRKLAPELDVEVERFALEKFDLVVGQFGKGGWAIQPDCKSALYKAEYAK